MARVDELGLERRLAVLEPHLDDLAQGGPQSGDVGGLAVSAGPARHGADQQAGLGVTLDDEAVRSHGHASLRPFHDSPDAGKDARPAGERPP